MKKKVLRLALIALAAAAVLLFTSCPEDGGGGAAKTYVGNWEYIDIEYGNPNILDEDDEKEEFKINGDGTWQITVYWYLSSTWDLMYLMRGTYTVSGDTITVTLDGLSIPSSYGADNWFDDTYWSDPYYGYGYLYMIYYDYFYYYLGANPFDVTYSLSSDGDTLTVTYDYGYFGLDPVDYTRM